MERKIRRVVVTGMGAITPVGNDIRTMWSNLTQGVHGIAPITRFDTAGFKATLAAEVKNFDPTQYMDKGDVRRSDLYAQYAVAAAAQAVEDSGVIGTLSPERIGVYMGSGIGGIHTFEVEHKKYIERGPRMVSPFFIPMLIGNMASGMIAIRYDCRNAAMPAVTACASGSNAIGEALRAIRHGYADAIIAGGTEAPICEMAVSGFGNMQALSLASDPDQASLPFDERRCGFLIGEGAGALVLEEYEHAAARGAMIYGEICGYGSTCDAHHITAPLPDARGGAQAMMDALVEACYHDGERVYVNAHGTGTPLNDVAETIAIKKALGEESAYLRTFVSSTKSMTGHMLGAAGAVEAIACVLALKEGVIPPTANLHQPDPKCDLNCVPNCAIQAPVDLALSNSLGFGGHNACLAFRKVEK